MKTKQNLKEASDFSADGCPCNDDPYNGTGNALEDFRRDENGLDRMENGTDDDCFEGYPI